jgi:hypothetical protein
MRVSLILRRGLLRKLHRASRGVRGALGTFSAGRSRPATVFMIAFTMGLVYYAD